MVFVYPLHPNTCAKGVPAFGEAQVISQAVVFPDVAKGVVTGRPRDRRRDGGSRAASDRNRAGITPAKKQLARKDRPPSAVRGGDRGCIRTSPPQGRGIDDSGGDNMRFLQAERLGCVVERTWCNTCLAAAHPFLHR